MGSDSDWSVMEAAATALAEFDVPYEVGVYSAHRTPQRMLDYATSAADRGIQVIIAGAGGAAHLPGMVASATPLPVVGVPVPLRTLDGMDSLLSIAQMPAGVPVGTMAIGGARNAASTRCGSWPPPTSDCGRRWPRSRPIWSSRCWPRTPRCGSAPTAEKNVARSPPAVVAWPHTGEEVVQR